MNVSDINNIHQFYEFADVWYQRTHRLREIWQNEDENVYKRVKAFLLYIEMYKRMMKLFQIAIRISQPIFPKKY